MLILGGAALAASLVLTSGKKQEYLVVAHDVALGQTLTRDDFRQQALAATNSSLFAPVPVCDFFTRVQGKKALVALKQGSLLSEGTFGNAVTPAKGLMQMRSTSPTGNTRAASSARRHGQGALHPARQQRAELGVDQLQPADAKQVLVRRP